MVALIFNHSLTDEGRRARIFKGDLLVYSSNPATSALCAYARELIDQAFAPVDPLRAQFSLPVERFAAIAGALKSRYTNDGKTKELIRDVLASYGCDLESTYFDVPRLRIAPHGDYLTAGVSYAYKPHRDTWYAGPDCQINLWLPVYPVVPECAMSIFPSYWDHQVENSSGNFDYGEWCREGRTQAAAQIKRDTRKHPLPLGRVDDSSELRVAGGVGDLLIFSAAHLHATAPNQSGYTRFSTDFRTLSLKDLEGGRGASNPDSQSTGTTVGDFIRASDFAPMPAAIVEEFHFVHTS